MQYFVPFSQVPVPPFIPNPDRGAWGLLLCASTDADGPPSRRPCAGPSSAAGRRTPFIRVRPYAQLLDRQIRPCAPGDWRSWASLQRPGAAHRAGRG